MAKQRQWARELGNKAGAVADRAIDTFAAVSVEAASMSGQAKAISGIAESCAVALREQDHDLAAHLLVSIRELTVAQQQTCVNIRDRATTMRLALVAARRGEYRE